MPKKTDKNTSKKTNSKKKPKSLDNKNKDLDQRLAILDHVESLKNTFFQLLIFWLIGTFFGFIFYEKIFGWLLMPLEAIGKTDTLLILRPIDSFMIMFKISGLSGLILSLPALLFVLWKFISPAFKTKEKKFILAYILAIICLSIVGILYGYFQIIPGSLEFLLNLNPAGTTTSLTLVDYLDFLVFLLAALIVVFQTPVLVFSLIFSGLVSPQAFSQKRRHIYLIILIVLAILTPTPDVVTLSLIALPVVFLFELSLVLSRFVIKNKNI